MVSALIWNEAAQISNITITGIERMQGWKDGCQNRHRQHITDKP